MSKRCFSLCRKQTKKDCNKTRRCRYNVGNKRNFCRLNMSKYKMNKDCVVKTRITNKNETNETAKVIQRNVKIINYKKEQILREKARKEIREKFGNNLTKNEEKIYTDFLVALMKI